MGKPKLLALSPHCQREVPDRSSTGFKTRNIAKDDYGTLFEGAVVPVRYDLWDHSKVALDLPALKARQAQSKAAEEGALDAQFERLAGRGRPESVEARSLLALATSAG